MNTITIVLPISRYKNLETVLTSIELLDTGNNIVSIIAIVDGDESLYVKARNLILKMKFEQKLCVKYRSEEKSSNFNVLIRRKRISDIHNEVKKSISKCDYIFLLEDDGIIKSNALEMLFKEYLIDPYIGFVSGLEIGRWGYPHIGAWTVDSIYDTKFFYSIDKPQNVTNVDASGFYCLLTRYETYMSHVFKPYGNNQLGPDVDFGIELRKQGYINKVHDKVLLDHLTDDHIISFSNTETVKLEIGISGNSSNIKPRLICQS